MPQNVDVRTLAELPDLQEACDLFVRVWRSGPATPAPRALRQEDRETLWGFEDAVVRIPNIFLAQRLFGDPDYVCSRQMMWESWYGRRYGNS